MGDEHIAMPEWWTAHLTADIIMRMASPAGLWSAYRKSHDGHWDTHFYTEFAAYGKGLDVQVAAPPARKAVFFVDLVPPFPSGGRKYYPDDRVMWRFGDELAPSFIPQYEAAPATYSTLSGTRPATRYFPPRADISSTAASFRSNRGSST